MLARIVLPSTEQMSRSAKKYFRCPTPVALRSVVAMEAMCTIGEAGKSSLIFLPSELEELCQDNYATKEPLVEKTTKIASALSAARRKFLASQAEPDCETFLFFAGYDPEKQRFFLTQYRFSGTNLPDAEPIFEKDPEDRIENCQVFGQERFYGALYSSVFSPPTNEDVLAPYITDELRKRMQKVGNREPISAEEMKNCVLEMFRLNQQVAIRLGLDRRPISEPWVLFQITRGKTVKLN